MKYVIATFLMLIGSGLIAQANWELVEKEEDMTVYVRKQEGSKVKEVKVEGRIKCELSELVKALEDVEGQTAWVESTIEATILDQQDAAHFIFYQSTDMPYPVKDRDVVLQYSRQQDPNTKAVSIEFRNIEGQKDISEDFVRIPDIYSGYTLKPDGAGHVSLDYILKIDPGGKMPKWVINMAITKGPIDTIRSLFDRIMSGHYKGVVVDGVAN